VAFKIVVIGTSLGGFRALASLLTGLPANFNLPIAVVQHRHPESDRLLTASLQRFSQLPVVEAEDKQPIHRGQVYLAPANYHLLIEAPVDGTPQPHFALSTDVPVAYARPSIDVLFESAANTYAERAIGVILTGASHDGAQGLATIKAYGGIAIVQDPQTAECPIMPKAALTKLVPQNGADETSTAGLGNAGTHSPGTVDRVLSLAEIAPVLITLSQQKEGKHGVTSRGQYPPGG